MGDLLNDGQACARATHLASHRLLKQLEDPLRLIRLNPDPTVAHHNPCQRDHTLRQMEGGDFNVGDSSGQVEFQRVRNQVVQRLRDPRFIDAKPGNFGAT